ncbi:MAG: LacI family DNA-binding transcriptional regulator [Anaerolineales bacterium]|jgi:LacI family transcriptional regulator
MPTIRDVAKLAGVAPITASRVISHSGYASEDVRQRVNQAAEQLGYVPNSLARSLRSKRTRTLALVLTDITNPFWTTVARGVEDAASEVGYHVIFCNTDESASKQQSYLEAMIQKQVDGILLVPAHSKENPIGFLHQQNVQVVLLDRRLPDMQADVVRCDSRGGAYQLVQLLVKLGHRRIAILGGPSGVSSADDRVAGYKLALHEAGLKSEKQLIISGEFSVESGYEMTRSVLALPSRPTALFAGNNFIAIGALKALHDAELVVPKEMSVVGFDDLPAAIVVDPFLTVAVQPAYEMGQRATKRLLECLDGENTGGVQDIVLPVSIIERKSTQAQA